MEQTDTKQFAQCMAALGESFSQEASKLKHDIYFKALSEFPIEAVERATWHIIRTRVTSTFPKVAELREAIQGKAEDLAQLALEKVEKAVRHIGGYSSVVFDDPIIHRTVESFDGGWVGICDMRVDDWKWSRKDFIKIYEAVARSGQIGKVIAVLPGRHELSNTANCQGNKFSQIVYVGKKELCLEWQKKYTEIEQQEKTQLEHITAGIASRRAFK